MDNCKTMRKVIAITLQSIPIGIPQVLQCNTQILTVRYFRKKFMKWNLIGVGRDLTMGLITQVKQGESAPTVVGVNG
jgi:hypothetical protein